MASSKSGELDIDLEHWEIPVLSRIDRYYRARMVVVGKNTAIINNTSRKSEVALFT